MKQELLRELPSVDEVLRSGVLDPAMERHSRALVTRALRDVLAGLREGIRSGAVDSVDLQRLPDLVDEHISGLNEAKLRAVVNASGTVIHTNLGRAVLPDEAVRAIAGPGRGNCNVEYDLARGARGRRDDIVEELLVELTEAEAACVVNNNAAAVLLVLNTLAEGKEVVISRGELIEIGGSFRLPEIIKKSGCVLREVGTTNRTHRADYAGAVGPETGVLFKAHTSNYLIEGFTAEVPFDELVGVGRDHGIPVVEDLGSGSLVDLSAWGLPGEPVVRDIVAAGADVVTFSGDKLLGGPQAGLIVGARDVIDRVNANPLKRALRPGKLTLAALEATLLLYRDAGSVANRVPALRHLARPVEEIDHVAVEAAALVAESLGDGYAVEVADGESVAGGGSMPGVKLPTRVVVVTHPERSPEEIFEMFLSSDPPVVGRISNGSFTLDMRTIEDPSLVAVRPGEKGFRDR